MRSFKSNIKFAWKYAKSVKSKLLAYTICNIFTIAISIFVPILSAKIIISLTSNAYYQLISIAIVIFLVEIFRNIINYFSRFFVQIIYRETFSKIQVDLGSQILKLDNETLDKNGSGVFIQRITNDTSMIADVFNSLSVYITGVVTNIGVFVAIFILSKAVFIYLIIMITLLFIIENKRINKRISADKEFRKKREKVTGFIAEIVRGSRDIRMLNSERSFINTLKDKIINLNIDKYKMESINRKYKLFSGSLKDLTDLLLIILLVYLLSNNVLVVASSLVIYNYSGRVSSIIYDFTNLIEEIKSFNLSASRIFDIMESDEFKKEEFGHKHINKVNGDFEFKNVSFCYGENEVLKNLSFNVKANETVAFVGKSGAGKTTIFNLLCKMYAVEKGEITIDNININELDKDSIRGNITIISQNPYIFNLSIKDNLKLVKSNLTNKEMKRACHLACLDEFINSLPNKYDTIIGEGGVNLSGGQKQRLAIARAFVQKTEIILFDEATSALDNETQENIQKAIENLKKHYTILIVAHRLSTIINCDRILLLNNGRIEAQGTHKELLNKSRTYRKLYKLELRK